MRNAYVQVALTYLRRAGRIAFALAVVCLGLILGLCVAAFFLGLRHGRPEFSHDLLTFPLTAFCRLASSAFRSERVSLVLAMLLSFGSALHLREQFANPRARLLPHFVPVHLAIGAAAALLIGIFIPLLLAWVAGCDRLGFLSIAVFLSGVLLCAGSFRWIGWVALVALYSCIGASADDGLKWINHPFKNLISGQSVGLAISLLGLGAAMICLAWRRLAGLNEETIGYDWASQTGGRVGFSLRAEGRGSWSRFLHLLRGLNEEREISRVLRHAKRASASSWSRTCRWQVGMATGRSLWFFALAAILAADFLFWTLSTYSRWQWDPAALLSFTSLPWLVFVPAASLAQFYQRKQVIGHELLLPLTRKAYFRGLGLAALFA